MSNGLSYRVVTVRLIVMRKNEHVHVLNQKKLLKKQNIKCQNLNVDCITVVNLQNVQQSYKSLNVMVVFKKKTSFGLRRIVEMDSTKNWGCFTGAIDCSI